MTYSYLLPHYAIDETFEDVLRNLLDGDPLSVSLSLEDYEITELLAAQQKVADIWSVNDVLELRPDLTAAQAWDVLKTVQDEYDADYGITNQIITEAAIALYGRATIA